MKAITVKDYARGQNVTEKTIYNRIKRGELKTKKVLNQTLIVISEA